MESDHDTTTELTRRLETLSQESSPPEYAFAKANVQSPLYPPKYGCPINDLPTEILAYIFSIGAEMDLDDDEDEEDDLWEYYEDDGADEHAKLSKGSVNGPDKADSDGTTDSDADDNADDDDDDENTHFLFAILVSHVCRHWRQVALDTASLWTTICFSIENPTEKAAAFIEVCCYLFDFSNC